MYLSILPFKGKNLEADKLLTKVISGHWKKTRAIFFYLYNGFLKISKKIPISCSQQLHDLKHTNRTFSVILRTKINDAQST